MTTCLLDCPAPSVTIDEALRSETARAQRDRQLAAWCGLGPDEVGPFLRRLAEFDARTHGWRLQEALEDEFLAMDERKVLAMGREDVEHHQAA